MVSNRDDGKDRPEDHSDEKVSPKIPGAENDSGYGTDPLSGAHDGASGASGEEIDADLASDADPNRTWVPSQTPTQHGSDSSFGGKKEEETDPNKTFVPSQTPTTDALNPPPGHHDSDVDASGDDDIDGTVVMGDRPSGEDSMKSGPIL